MTNFFESEFITYRMFTGAMKSRYNAAGLETIAAFERELKDIVYMGALLCGGYKDYFRMFFNFYEEVFLFLKTHPLSHTFGAPRALQDLRKVVDNY